MTLHEDPWMDGSTVRVRTYPPTTLGVSIELSLIPDLGGVLRYLFTYSDQGGRVGQSAAVLGCSALPSLTDGPFSGHVRLLLNQSLLPLPPMPTPQPLTLAVLKVDPMLFRVTPDERILLPTRKITFYLDGALAVLGLHTEIRMPFVT